MCCTSQLYVLTQDPSSQDSSLFFTATIDEIVVIQHHVPADLSPSKVRLASRFLAAKATAPAKEKAPAKGVRAGPSGPIKRHHI
jgi:hypothetical protein